MANKNNEKDPAGLEQGNYIVNCTFLAMLVADKGAKVGASLKATGEKEEQTYAINSSQLKEGVVITVSEGQTGPVSQQYEH